MSTSESKTGGMRLRICRGFPMPGAPWFVDRNIEAAMDYVPLEDDIVLCSYPKTGTTWMSYITWGILHSDEKRQQFPGLKEVVVDAVPFIEFQDCVERVKELPKPRFYKHHFPLDRSQWNPAAKYIYVLRHPEDVIASYFPFSKETSGNDADLDTFFDHFLAGQVAYGSYFDHINSFHGRRNDGNFLMVFYEDLKSDIRSEVLRIAKFLGEEYHRRLVEDPSALDLILKMSSFEHMKSLATISLPVPGGSREVQLVREGKVGQGKKLLGQQQLDQLRKVASEKLKDERLVKKWYPDG